MKHKPNYIKYYDADNQKIDKSKRYIQHLQLKYPELHRKYCQYGDGDFVKGWKKIWEEYESTICDITNIWHMIKDVKRTYISIWLKENNAKIEYRFLYSRLHGVRPADPFNELKQLRLLVTPYYRKRVDEWLKSIYE